MLTAQLDCLGFDPDAVMEKLKEVQGTVYVTSAGVPDITGIMGWPQRFRRVKAGILVEWLPLAEAMVPREHHLAIMGQRTLGQPDFRVVGLELFEGALR